MSKFNLGSGQRPFQAPWVNVDGQERWKPDIVGDIGGEEFWQGPVNGAEVLCLHHVLEHFGLGEGHELVRRCYEALITGGRLWVFVPNIQALSRAYVEGKLEHYQFMVNLYGAYMGDEMDRHKWGYTMPSLHKVMKEVGFRHIRPWSAGDPVVAILSKGADIAQDWWILGMEGIK